MSKREKKILVVDDSRNFVTYATILLRKMGFYKTILAENGVEALKLMKLVTPDVVIMDIDMPDMDGMEALKLIREDKKTAEIPVIMMTGHNSRKLKRECSRLGCTGFINKPLDVAKLNDLLQKCIASSDSERRLHLRTNFHGKVMVSCNGTSTPFRAVTLSEGGIYLEAGERLPEGAEVEVTIPVTGTEELRLKGRIIYSGAGGGSRPRMPEGMAVKFKKMDAEEADRLSDYVMELITDR